MSAVLSVLLAAYIAFALPSVTYVSPTLSDNATTGSNWVYVNLTSSENLNQSLLEWGNSTGFTNVSMSNSSMTNWYTNMTGLTNGTYNYTVWAQNTTGNWNQSARKWVTVNTVPPYNLTACQDLTIAGGSYVLVQNVSSAGTCFNILADNITLDGQGYTVNYSQTAVGYGVNITSRNNVTVKNLNIVQRNSSVASAYGIYSSSMTNSTITNTSITTSGSASYGMYLTSSSSNNITNSNITANALSGTLYVVYLSSSNSNMLLNNMIYTPSSVGYALLISSSSGNNITGGSIIGGGYSYRVYNAGTTNNFTNTNFTASRKIYFYDATSWFNYRNDSVNYPNLWLKTNLLAGSALTRTLNNWSKTYMDWNDTNIGITATYNITGLLANTQYMVYNTSAGVQTNSYALTADSGGALGFTIAISGNTEIIVNTTAAGAPAVALNSPINNFNQTTAAITFNCTAYDAINLTNVTLYNNLNGTWAANGTNSSGINNTAYIFARTAPANGTFIWNCLAYNNLSLSSFAPQNYVVTVDAVPPASNSPANASYPQNSSATIGWILYDNYAPGYYTVYRNGTIQNQSTWSNSTSLNIWVNTTTIGIWNYTITYNDSLGNNGLPNTVIINITGDLIPPQYSLNSTNSTTVGASVMHSLYWTDNVALSGYIFSFDNGTGTFANDSWITFSGTGNWSNVTKSVNATTGSVIRWRVYANDTSNNWNTSAIYSYATTNNPPSYSNVGTNNTVTSQSTLFYALWTDDTGLSGFIFSTNNSGTWINDTWQPMTGFGNWSNATKILNSTQGLTVSYRFYANDTSNNWNTSAIYSLVTTNSSQMSLLKTWEYGPVESVSITGNTMYASFGNILRIYNVSDPANPVLTSEVQDAGIVWPGGSHAGRFLDSNNKLVAINRFGEGIMILDLASMAKTKIKYDVDVSGIALSNDTLYIATNNNIILLNVTNPSSPYEILRINAGSSGAFSDGNLILSANGAALNIYSMSGGFLNNYTLPKVLVNGKLTQDVITDIAFSGTNAVIGTAYGYVLIYNLSSNQLVGSYFSGANARTKVSVYSAGSNIYITAAFHDVQVQIINITNSSSLVKVSIYDYRTDIGGYPRDIKVFGNYFALSAQYRGISLVNISSVTAPARSSKIPAFGRATAATFSGDGKYVYLIDDMGFRVLDVSGATISNAAFIDYGARGWRSIDIDRKKGIVYAPATWGGLKIINITDPLNPSVILTYKYNPSYPNVGAYADAVKMYGNLLLLGTNVIKADHTSVPYLVLLDVSSPSMPKEAGVYQLNGRQMNNIEAKDNIAYMGIDQSIIIFNITNSLNITNLSSVSAPYTVERIRVSGNLLYATIDGNGTMIVNITNPSNPNVLNIYKPYYGGTEALYVSGTNAYVSFDAHITQVNVSNPAVPTIIQDELIDTHREIRNFDVLNNIMVASMYAGGVRLYATQSLKTIGDPTLSLTSSSTGSTSYTNSTAVNVTTGNDASATAWLLNETQSTQPAAGDPRWSTARPKNYTFSSSTEGVKTAYLWVKDAGGNINTGPVSDSITLDTTPPSLAGSSPANNSVVSSFAAITFVFSDNFDFDEVGTSISATLNGAPFTTFSRDNSITNNITLSFSTTSGLYAFTIIPRDMAGNAGNQSVIYVNATGAVLAAPSAPQSLAASAGDGFVSLSWSPPASDGGTPITNYKIYINGMLNTITGNVLAYNFTGLTNNVTYSFMVSAVNMIGEGSNSSAVIAMPFATPTLPSMPLNPAATAGNGQIVLSWFPPSSDGGSPIIGYNIYRGLASGAETPIAAALGNTSYTDTNLTNGQTYYYIISALNVAGEGDYSAEVSATPVAGIPAGSSPSSGGSGGDGGGSSVTTTRTITMTPNDIVAKITVYLKTDASSPSISVAKLSSVPVPITDPVYSYLNITKSNFNNSDIDNSTIEFIVNKSWIAANNVTSVYLARYENRWNKLRTDLINSTSEYNNYRAYTNAFSYFAIIGEKAAILANSTENMTQENRTAGSGTATNVTQPAEGRWPPDYTYALYAAAAVLAAAGIIFAAVRSGRRKRAKGAKAGESAAKAGKKPDAKTDKHQGTYRLQDGGAAGVGRKTEKGGRGA